MNRTTIMLPAPLHRRAAASAAAKGWSLGRLIRHLLERETEDEGGDDVLFSDRRTFAGPADLAESHDEALYDEEPVRTPSAEEPRAFRRSGRTPEGRRGS